MNNLFEDISCYLPSYLNYFKKQDLLEEIRHFCSTLETRGFYTDYPSDSLLQGDILDNILIYNAQGKSQSAKAFMLSNSCDMNKENLRLSGKNVCYSPVISLEKYLLKLRDKFGEQRILQFENDIKKQKFTNVLYIPSDDTLPDSIILFDRIINIDRSSITDERIVSLSNYGFYFLLVKLSIHFMRLHEDFDRDG